VHLGPVTWLCLGSIPGAFSGVLLLRLIDDGARLQTTVLVALGVILVLASLAMAAKAYLKLRERERRRSRGRPEGVEPPLSSIPRAAWPPFSSGAAAGSGSE
jgi:uncharacterized protein